MSEEAERIAIEFGIWLSNNYDAHYEGGNRWVDPIYDDRIFSTEDVMREFKKEAGYV